MSGKGNMRISKKHLSHIYKVPKEILERILKPLKLTHLRYEDELSEEELERVFNFLGKPLIKAKNAATPAQSAMSLTHRYAQLLPSPEFLAIDGDESNAAITRKIIGSIYPNARMDYFSKPEDGFAYIRTICADPPAAHVYIFIDVKVTGWDIFDRIAELTDCPDNLFTLFILSTPENEDDMRRAKKHPIVKDYIKKPLTSGRLTTILRFELKYNS